MVTDKITRSRFLFFGFILLWIICYFTICADYPKIYSPYSFPVVIPLLILSDLLNSSFIAIVVSTLIVPILFMLSIKYFLQDSYRITNVFKIVVFVIMLISTIFLLTGWRYGIQYQGYRHTIAMYIFNAMFITILFILNRINKIKSSYISNFLFQWIFFSWLGWSAFPWLGELI